MPGPSAEDLEKIRSDNKKLREQIAAAKAQRSEREADAANTVQYAELQAEQLRLQAQLADAKELAKVGTIKAGAENVLSSVKDQLEAASVQADAAGQPPVDTNAGNDEPKGGNS